MTNFEMLQARNQVNKSNINLSLI